MKAGYICLSVTIMVVLLSNNSVFGVPKTAQDAQTAVEGWLVYDVRPFGLDLGSLVQRVEAFTNEAGNAVYYIVYLEPGGFVIVPAESSIEPIIGFCAKGSYDPSTDNALGALVNRDLGQRVALIQQLGQHQMSTALRRSADAAENKWSKYKEIAENRPVGPDTTADGGILSLGSVTDTRVDPLVKTKWAQRTCCDSPLLACYNYYTPQSDMSSVIWNPDDPYNYPCGCVATAMAQVMRYHTHPAGPAGGSYPITVDGINTTAVIRGGDGMGGNYNWGLMVYEPNCTTLQGEREAIGALCYDAGVSVNMSYSAGGSNALMTNADAEFVNQFSYSNSIYGSNVLAGLTEMINPNLDFSHPVILSLIGALPEHAVVVDGYGYSASTMYHHINMGWAGEDDAWYHFCTDMPPGYSSVFESIYNIFVADGDEIISGRVTDTYGNPMASETVTAKASGGGIYQSVTNSRGIYALGHVPSATTYTVSVTKDGYSFNSRVVTTGISADGGATAGNVWAVDFTPFGGPGVNIYVDENAMGNNDGTTWQDAYTYLQDAFGTATNGDRILVAMGTYKPDETNTVPGGTGLRTDTFQLITGVEVYGGFPPGGTNSWDDRDVTIYETILSGDIGTQDDSSDNSYHVVTGSGTDATAVLDGFTIKAGNADGPNSDQKRGGGMYNSSGSPTVANCTFTENEAEWGSGAMDNHTSSDPDVSNCTFIANTTDPVVLNYGSNPTYTNCTFRDNTGSAMGNNYSSLKVSNCTFINNTGSSSGGGMWNSMCTNPKIVNCAFIGNSVTNFGGGMWNRNSSPKVVNCLYSGNAAAFHGGGMFNKESSNPTVSNCTFCQNTAASNGGGIYNETNSSPTIVNSILWNNSDSSGTGETAQIYTDTGSPAVTYSCIKDNNPDDASIPFGGAANNNIDDDPQFADADGFDNTPGTEDDNLRLLGGNSPCIDTGNDDGVYADVCDLDKDGDTSEPTPFDLDMHPRFSDCDGAFAVDMGAYELAWVYIGDLDGDCDVDLADFTIFAGHWLMGK